MGEAAIFTGIITSIARVAGNERRPGSNRLTLDYSVPAIAPGSSIGVNGACLTVSSIDGARISFDVVPETLARTNLGSLREGDAVNVEPSLRVGDELGGHIVYGHVDATTIVLSVHPEGDGARLFCITPPALARLIAPKGYIALDGVSLTVAAAHEGQFAVALIPETMRRTTLGSAAAGTVLNVEADPIARYVNHILRSVPPA